MAKCVFCNVELTAENSAKEHIIPNAIGGRLKSSDLDCVKCNSECGADCDDALARDLNPLANLLGIERDRGEPQPIDGVVGGKGVRLEVAGKPEFAKPELEVKKDGKKVEIKLAARSISEARKMIEGLARKYPIDVEAAMKQAQLKRTYLPDFVEFKFAHGGKDTFRAVTKMAYLFLKHKRPGQALDRETQIIEFIKGACDYKAVYFLPGERVVEPAAGQVLHSVVIKSFPVERLLVAFVELFSVFSFVIVLSEDCAEEVFEHYVYDVIERKEVASARFRIPNIDRKTLADFFDRMPSQAAAIETRFAEFLKIATDRRRKAATDEVMAKALERSLMRYPEGTTITKEMIDEFMAALEAEAGPLLAHLLGPRR